MEIHTKQTGLSHDPAEVFGNLVGRHDTCFLLETLSDEHQPLTSGRSYIGVQPSHSYTAQGGIIPVDGRKQPAADPYAVLRQHRRSTKPGFYGGLVGYASHEMMRMAEPELPLDYQRDWPDFEFGEFADGLVFEDGQPPVYFHREEKRLELYEADSGRSPKLIIEYRSAAKDQKQYGDMVEQARRDIQNGRVFQAVLANRYEYRFTGELFQLYQELRRVNPSPFMFFLKFGKRITMGASPELLLKVSQNKVHVEALAGTIKRGRDEAEDARLAHQLRHDEKEIAEHNMLVDLYRNDLGRVSRVGSVSIDDLMYVKKLSHVQHLCSLISGELAEGRDMFDAFSAVFPAGTLVGAPKIEAAKMIAQLEGYERGPFGGSVGYFGYNGEAVHAVNIRAVNAVRDKLHVHTGSGIVYDSRPDREYAEISAKKAAMDKAMSQFLRKDAS
jgi:anthranilate synthase component 1